MPMTVAFAERMDKLQPAIPIRKPDLEAEVVKVLPAKEVDKDVLVTVFLKDRDTGVPITQTTAIRKWMGKLVPVAEVGDLKAGVTVSVWLAGERAETPLLFP